MSTCVLNFDMINPRAQAWAGQRSATAVRGITAEARRAVRNILARGFAEGIPHGQMARMLRSVIGLTEGQANAVMNLRASILKNPGKLIRAGKVPIRVPKAGFTEAALERRLKSYSRRLLNRRAYTIARNETMTAANIGQHQLWQQAQEQRLLRSTQVKEWIVTPDDRLCEICEPLNGSAALLNEPFEDIGVQSPPAHILCRCTMGLSVKKGTRDQLRSDVLRSDKGVDLKAKWLKAQESSIKLRAKTSPKFAKALDEYTGGASGQYNTVLRRDPGILSRLDLKDPTHVGIREMNLALHAPYAKVPSGTTLYRGLHGGYSDKLLMQLKPGAVLQMNGFQSTSLLPSIGEKFTRGGGYVLEISGATRGLAIGGINEGEILLQHATKFRVDAIQKGVKFLDRYGDEQIRTVIQVVVQ